MGCAIRGQTHGMRSAWSLVSASKIQEHGSERIEDLERMMNDFYLCLSRRRPECSPPGRGLCSRGLSAFMSFILRLMRLLLLRVTEEMGCMYVVVCE